MAFDAHGYYYPDLDGTTAPDFPADMQQLVQTLSDHTILWASDSADRDSKYGTDKAGVVVVTPVAPFYVWLKSADGTPTWLTLFKDSGWVTDGFIFNTNVKVGSNTYNFSQGSFYKARNRNGLIDVRFEMSNDSDPISASPSGNFGDIPAANIPAQFAPASETMSGRFRATNCSGNFDLRTGGAVYLTDMNANSSVGTSDTIRCYVKFLEG